MSAEAPDKAFYDAARALKQKWTGDPHEALIESDMAILRPAIALATSAILDAFNAPIVITASDVPHFQTIAAHLEREEGRVDHAYQDNLGYWTIGVGRLIDKRRGGKLSDDEIDTLLVHDICAKIDAIKDWPAWQAVKDDPVRSTALLSMAFQLGVEGLAGFKNSLQLIADRQWHQAASNLMASLWARQTPNRARRVTQMIATGVMQQ